MSFVADAARLEAFHKICSEPGYSQEAIGVEFVTTKEFIESVLPPGFEAASEPTGLISVSTWESNVCGDFELSSVSIRCKVGTEEGYYVLNLIVSEHFAITWGRESWGEIKKQGKPRLFCSGTRRYGHCERRGTRLIEMEADFTEELPADVSEWLSFEVKAIPSATGSDTHTDPNLIKLKVMDHNKKRSTGKGKLTLRGSKSDPLHTIPVLSIGDFQYVSGPTEWRVQEERRLCDGKSYLPWLVGRHYDDFADFRVGANLDNFNPAESDSSDMSRPRTWISR